MTAEQMARRTGKGHASAVRRLAGARDEQGRLAILLKAAVGTAAEPLAQERLSAGRAYVAARQEWLHWIDEGESLAPWADGEWAPEAPAGPPTHRRLAATATYASTRSGSGVERRWPLSKAQATPAGHRTPDDQGLLVVPP